MPALEQKQKSAIPSPGMVRIPSGWDPVYWKIERKRIAGMATIWPSSALESARARKRMMVGLYHASYPQWPRSWNRPEAMRFEEIVPCAVAGELSRA